MDSNVANAAKESTQGEFSHGLLEFCKRRAPRVVSMGWLTRKLLAKVMDDQLSLADAKLAWRIALHEAGHSVAARLMGLPVNAASAKLHDAYADFPDDCGMHSIVALFPAN